MGRYLKNEAKGKMLAMYNKLKNNTEGIKQDAQVVGFGTNWENAVDDDIAKAMKDKDRWISRTIQLEVDFSSYEGMVTTLATPELNNTRSFLESRPGWRKRRMRSRMLFRQWKLKTKQEDCTLSRQQ